MKSFVLDAVSTYDSYEEERTEGSGTKSLFLVIQILFLHVSFVRPYVLLFWLLGCLVIVSKIYLTVKRNPANKKSAFMQELGCAWKSGDLTLDLFIFWPFDLLISIITYLTGGDISFSTSYRLAKLSAYRSERGKYYGMRPETASLSSYTDVEKAQAAAVNICQKVGHTGRVVKQQSRVALLYTSIVGFLTSPFGWFRNPEKESAPATVSIILTNTEPVPAVFPEAKAIVDNFLNSLLKMFRLLANLLLSIIVFINKQLPTRKMLWFIPPIRGIPLQVFRRTNQVRAPSMSVLVGLNQTGTLKLIGGQHEIQTFYNRGVDFLYVCPS